MKNPIASQMMSRHQFSAGRENIRSVQVRMPRMGVRGTKGALNGRGAFGFVRRMMRTAAQTTTNATSVTMFTSSARTRRGRKAARVDTKIPVMMVDFQGVLNLSWTAAKKLRGT